MAGARTAISHQLRKSRTGARSRRASSHQRNALRSALATELRRISRLRTADRGNVVHHAEKLLIPAHSRSPPLVSLSLHPSFFSLHPSSFSLQRSSFTAPFSKKTEKK